MFIISLLTPAVLGTLVLSRLWRDRGWLVVMGYGFILGVAILVISLKLQRYLGLDQRLLTTLMSMTVVSAILYVMAGAVFGRPESLGSASRADGLDHGSVSLVGVAFAAVLVVLLCLRFLVIGADNALRPLFPWDAWEAYGRIAKLWFYMGGIVDTGAPTEWLGDEASSPVYPAEVSPKKGIAHVYIMYWSALSFGEWRDDLITLLWPLCGVAMAAGIYGQLRFLGVNSIAAVVLVYVLASLPLFNVHMILGGYPELWGATALGLAVASYLVWRKTRLARDLVVSISMAAICILFEQAGIFWATILAVSIMLDGLAVRRWRLFIYPMLLLPIIILGIMVATGQWLDMVRVERGYRVAIPFVGNRLVAFSDVSGPVLESLFLSANWGLFWWLALMAVAVGLFSDRRSMILYGPASFVVLVIGALFFEYYMIAHYSNLVWEKTVFDRMLLHVTPAVFVLLAWWMFAEKFTLFPTGGGSESNRGSTMSPQHAR